MIFHWMVGAGMQYRVNQISFPGFIGLTAAVTLGLREKSTLYSRCISLYFIRLVYTTTVSSGMVLVTPSAASHMAVSSCHKSPGWSVCTSLAWPGLSQRISVPTPAACLGRVWKPGCCWSAQNLEELCPYLVVVCRLSRLKSLLLGC